jgi:superoxide dismutase, Fe-Mn family
MAHELPDLPYEYDALEPHIDAETMQLHHTKHHAGYTKKFNASLEQADAAGYTIHGKKLSSFEAEELLMHINLVPETVIESVANNGGGFVNHKLFWAVMSPDGGGEPSGELLEAIEESFDSFAGFKEEFSEAAKTQFGSGWAWLVVNAEKRLEVVSTANQDTPLMSGLVPILGLDVWEHSYYLKYQNKRPEYVEAFFNVVNWDEVSRLFEKARN